MRQLIRNWAEGHGFTVESIWRNAAGHWCLHCLDSNRRLLSYIFQGSTGGCSIFERKH